MTWQQDNRVALQNDAPRAEIADKLTGKARYPTDYYPEGLLWAAFVRCPHGRARLVSHDVDAARRVKGVVDVAISSEEGRYPGDRIGHVCATSRRALEEAVHALALDFEWDRPRTQIDREKTPLAESDPGRKGKAAAEALDKAHVVAESTYGTQVQTHVCLEPHTALVDYRGDHAVAWSSTQGTFSVQGELADLLGLPQEKVEVHCEHVGGGFGSKFGPGPEGKLAAEMSKKHRRPCRVVLSRKEDMTDAGMRPGSRQYMKVGTDADGRIVAARIHTWGAVGPSGGGGGVRNPARYRFGKVAKTHEDVHLNSGFPRAMRAPGCPQGQFAIEMMMDELASTLGMDPVRFRKLNDDNQTRQKMYGVGAELIGWHRRTADGAGDGPLKRGFGVGAGDWGNRPGRATIDVHIHRSGTVEAFSGSQDIGTGFRSVLRDVVAHELGVPSGRVQPRVGVSSYPPGPASGGSKTSRITAPRMFAAAREARMELLKLVAAEWDVEASQLVVRDGVVTDGQRRMEWGRACKLIPDDRITASASKADTSRSGNTDSEAVQFAEVEVDVETGVIRVVKVVALQEMGQPVNRLTAENQVQGAVVQGLSFALFENRVLDRNTGAMVNANMEMYKIAGPVDVPEIVPIIWKARDDAPVNSLGEPPVIPTAGAIGCAVANALGVRIRHLPLTPARVLEALGKA